MRLQKYLARAGVASRRASERLITDGRVSVNGDVVRELGRQVDETADAVAVDGAPVRPAARRATLMLNKPAGYVTTMSDPQGRPCVAELVPVSDYPGLFPIGRLDRDTTGLLLFTTDGELGHALAHPSHGVEKTYVAQVQGEPSSDDVRRLERGVELEDGMTAPARVRIVSAGAASVVEISIHEGRKRQVKRMFEAVGHPVRALHRASVGPLSLGRLKPGAWRELTEREVQALSAKS